MNVIGWNDFLRKTQSLGFPVSLTIGVFDGLHRGHQALIAEISREEGTLPWVMTFHPHPSRVLGKRPYPGDIMTRRQKVRYLGAFGIHTTVIIDFSWDFGTLRGTEFLSFIQKAGYVRLIAVGENFYCGYNMDTSARRMKDLLEPVGINVRILSSVSWKGEVVSSTRIRSLIQKGDLSGAAEMLGHPFELDVKDLPAVWEDGRCAVSRTAITQVLPRVGAYPVVFQTQDSEEKGMVEINEKSISWRFNGSIDAITFT